MSFKIENHWADVARKPTRKMSGTIKPEIIVMHYTCGWTTPGDIATLTESAKEVSAHLVLSREGEFTQLVPFNKRAWHAGPATYKQFSDVNRYSIGIEISNIGYLRKRKDGLYEDFYGNVLNPDGSFVSKTRNAHSAPRDWLVQKHPRLGSGDFVWEPYYPPQLKALDQMVSALVQAYPIKHIVSHEEIDNRKWKTDPGPAFPMERYHTILKNGGRLPELKKAPETQKEGMLSKIGKVLRWPL